ncbi:hypothetical protein EON64_12430, partial [archaeon]
MAPDLQTATETASAYRMDTLTLDGDIVSAKGSLEGGYIHGKYNKITLVSAIREASSSLSSSQEKLAKLEGQVQSLDQQINNVVKEIGRVENEQGSLQDQRSQGQKDLLAFRKNIQTVTAGIEDIQHSILTLEQDIKNLNAQVSMYREELKKKYVNKMTAEEEEQVRAYQERIDQLTQQLQRQQDELKGMGNAKQRLLIELQENLYKQKETAESRLVQLQSSSDRTQSVGRSVDYQQEIDKLLIDQQHLENVLDKVAEELEELQKENKELANVITLATSKLNDVRQQEKDRQTEIDNLMKENDKLLNKRSILLETIAAKSRALKEIGLVSQELYQKYVAFQHLSQLQHELKLVDSKLSKYANINRKALDQYISFNEQRVALNKRQGEITKDFDSIQMLIQNLDVQKDNNIIQTFQ